MEGIMELNHATHGTNWTQANGPTEGGIPSRKPKQSPATPTKSKFHRKRKPKARNNKTDGLSGQLDGSSTPKPQNSTANRAEIGSSEGLINILEDELSRQQKNETDSQTPGTKDANKNDTGAEQMPQGPTVRGRKPAKSQPNEPRKAGDQKLKTENAIKSKTLGREGAPPRNAKKEQTNGAKAKKASAQINADGIDGSDFYHHVNAQHLVARSQNTMFALPMIDLHIHMQLVHARMRSVIPDDDDAAISGFAQCNLIVDRLLKRTKNKDLYWTAQLQCMHDEYEALLAEQKAVSERLHRQLQVELVRWQEKCEQLETRSRSTKR